IGLALEWEIFDGGARQRRVELAESARRAAKDEITATRDRAISEIWKAYTDVKLAFRRLDVAAALLDASQQSYEDSLRSYRVGLGTLTDLLAARRELSRARFVELDTKVQLLEASAALAFTTGETSAARAVPDRQAHTLGPQINVVGSFFPSWMLCAAIGIVVAVVARWLFLRLGVDPYLGPRALVYPSLAILVTLVLWVALFRVSPMTARVGHEASPSWRHAWRRLRRLSVGGAVVAVIGALLQCATRPETDDDAVWAKFVGIAPQVTGHIVQLRVRDNHLVQEGELLF